MISLDLWIQEPKSILIIICMGFHTENFIIASLYSFAAWGIAPRRLLCAHADFFASTWTLI
jgi:hypothetical protein